MKAPSEPTNETQRQRALEQTGLLDSPEDGRLDRLTQIASFSLDVPIALVTLIDGDRQWFKSCQGLGVTETGRDISFCGHVVSIDAALVVPDALQDERFADNPLVTGPPHIRLYAGMPLHDESGYPLGSLCVIDTKPRELDESQLTCLQGLAELAEMAIQRDQHVARLKTQDEVEQLLQQIPGTAYQFRLWPDGTMAFPFISRGVEKLYGITPAEGMLDPQAMFRRTHPEDLPRVETAIQTSQQTLTPWNVEFRVTADNRNYRWVEGTSVPETQPDGSTLWHGFLGDIDQRKRAELALQSSEARLRGLFELSPIGIALNDFETGHFIELNDALLAPTGYTHEKFLQLSYWEVTPIEYEPQEQEALENLRTKGRYGPFEKEYIRRDGSRYPVLLQGILIEGDDGRPMIWSLIEDITERKHVDNMKNQFIATVNHELRTPLTSLLGSLKLVTGGAAGNLPAKAASLLTTAQRNGERLADLINDLLDMEKLVSGRLRFTNRDESLDAIVQESIEANRDLGSDRCITIDYSPCRFDFMVKVDRGRLIQALSNLLSNAIKFSPDNTAVEVTCTCDNQIIAIHVRDQGPGIPKEFESKLFDRFAQAEAGNRKRPGTGLGLAITKELLEQMNGSIHYHSHDSGGTTFTVALPHDDPEHQQLSHP